MDAMLTRAQWALVCNDARSVDSSFADAEACLKECEFEQYEANQLSLLPNDTTTTTLVAARPRTLTNLLQARLLILETLNALWRGQTSQACRYLRQLGDILDWWKLVQDVQHTCWKTNLHHSDISYVGWLSWRQMHLLFKYLSAVSLRWKSDLYHLRKLYLAGIAHNVGKYKYNIVPFMILTLCLYHVADLNSNQGNTYILFLNVASYFFVII
jgi:hypothetical protein